MPWSCWKRRRGSLRFNLDTAAGMWGCGETLPRVFKIFLRFPFLSRDYNYSNDPLKDDREPSDWVSKATLRRRALLDLTLQSILRFSVRTSCCRRLDEHGHQIQFIEFIEVHAPPRGSSFHTYISKIYSMYWQPTCDSSQGVVMSEAISRCPLGFFRLHS